MPTENTQVLASEDARYAALRAELCDPEAPGLSTRERARRLVDAVIAGRGLRGLRGATLAWHPVALSQLAYSGVPDTIDLPFDSRELRAEVQGRAQELL